MANDNDMTTQVPHASPDFRTKLAEEIARIAPEAVADGKIDVAKLRELIAEDAGTKTERFGLFWPGKRQALKAAQSPTTATLVPQKAASKEWENTSNVFIEGDNLEVLKTLQRHYHSKIRMIYIDPPYNTGKDFIYPDNYKEGLASYLEFTKQVDEEGQRLSTNPETAGRYHSNWLNMMYPRVKLARNLLAPNGIMYISIDEHELANLLRLCEEIFGSENVLGAFPVVMNLKGNQDAFGFAETHEYLVACARDKSRCDLGHFEVDEEAVRAEWEQDDYGLYKQADNLRATGVNAPRSKRPNLWYPIFLDTTTESYYVTADDKPEDSSHEVIWPVNPAGDELSWYWSKKKFESSKHDLILKHTSNGWQFYKKQRPSLEGTPTRKPKSIFFKPEYSTSTATKKLKTLLGGRYFNGPKPVPFIVDLLEISTDRDSIVLDFFSGSGTTAEAVMTLNARDGGDRSHIQVQLPEPSPPDSPAAEAGYSTIAELARSRIDLAGKEIKRTRQAQLDHRNAELDVGFRTYELADTNFSKWRLDSSIDEEQLKQELLQLGDSTHDDASLDDLLVEVLLKLGYSLSERVSEIDVEGLTVQSVDDGVLLAYLDEHTKPSLDQLNSLVQAASKRLVLVEDAFQGDDELKANVSHLCRTHNIDLWTA